MLRITKLFILLFLCLNGHQAFPQADNAKLLINDYVSLPPLTSWTRQLGNNNYDASIKITPESNNKLVLFSADPSKTTKPHNNRVELVYFGDYGSPGHDGTEGTDNWYSWRIMFPALPSSSMKKGMLICAQFHPSADKAPGSALTPHWSLIGNNLLIEGGKPGFSKSIEPNIWYTIITHVNWSHSKDKGKVQCWIIGGSKNPNTIRAYSTNNRATLWTDPDTGVLDPRSYLKIGVYGLENIKYYFNGLFKVYYDDVRSASTYDGLNLNVGVLPPTSN